jgi:hypothetical protein
LSLSRTKAFGVLGAAVSASILAMAGCGAILGIPDEVTRRDAAPEPPQDSSIPMDAAIPDVLVPPRDAEADGPVEASVDAGTDAAPECDVTKEFDTPQLIPSLSTPGHEGDPRFFADDELTVTFDAVRGDAGTTDIYQATRPSLGAAFGTPTKLDTINTDEYEHSGNLTQDGLAAFFERQDRATRISRIMRATRPSKVDPWGVASPVDLNAGTYTAFPFVRGDGSEIYLIAKTGADPEKIYVGKFQAGTGYVVEAVSGLNQGATTSQFAPVVSADGLALYFGTTTHLANPGRRDTDIWVATRGNTSAPFSFAREVPNVNTAQGEEPSWITANGCRLYLHSSRPGGPGGQDLYVAARKK